MAHLEKTQERDFPARARLRDRYFLRVVQDVLHDLRELRAGREGEVSGIDAEELWSWEDIILDNQAAAVVAGGVETHHGIDLPPVVVLLTRRARAPARAEAAGHVDPAPRALRCHAFNDAAARAIFTRSMRRDARAGANQIAPPRETRDGRRASERTRARLLRENDAVRGRIGDDTNAASCRARVRHCRSRADVARDRPRDC